MEQTENIKSGGNDNDVTLSSQEISIPTSEEVVEGEQTIQQEDQTSYQKSFWVSLAFSIPLLATLGYFIYSIIEEYTKFATVSATVKSIGKCSETSCNLTLSYQVGNQTLTGFLAYPNGSPRLKVGDNINIEYEISNPSNIRLISTLNKVIPWIVLAANVILLVLIWIPYFL